MNEQTDSDDPDSIPDDDEFPVLSEEDDSWRNRLEQRTARYERTYHIPVSRS